jgi:hypothetical protein
MPDMKWYILVKSWDESYGILGLAVIWVNKYLWLDCTGFGYILSDSFVRDLSLCILYIIVYSCIYYQ